MVVHDFPKIESPFVREFINGQYVVTDKIAEGMEWVFDDNGVVATEKLNGTNVSIIVEQGAVLAMYNRNERIPFINKGKRFITEGVLEAWSRGYIDQLGDGQHFGELIGPKMQGNPYKLEGHVWIPFNTYCKEHLRYKSFGKYPKTFQAFNEWFKTLMPLYAMKKGDKDGYVEGVVFHHPDGIRMAKLRKDMWPDYSGPRQHHIKET